MIRVYIIIYNLKMLAPRALLLSMRRSPQAAALASKLQHPSLRSDAPAPALLHGVTCWRNDDGGELVLDGTATTNDYGLFTDGQIMGIALDIDNYNISIYRNGSALASDVNMSSTRGTIFPFINTGISTTAEVNFGGCSAFTVSSGNADANGYGNFEYAVPSGYLALCTKNLGSDGG